MTATPPPGTAPSLVDLRWEAVTDTVYSHKVFIAGTTDGGAAELSGLLTHRQPVLQLQVVAPPAQQMSFSSMLEIGFGHFREGADHLLFLAMVVTGPQRLVRAL